MSGFWGVSSDSINISIPVLLKIWATFPAASKQTLSSFNLLFDKYNNPLNFLIVISFHVSNPVIFFNPGETFIYAE